MCGIVGFSGAVNGIEILIDGLRRLEYRGYDSSGVAVVSDHRIIACKATGKVKNLQALLSTHSEKEFLESGSVGIAHTRWATHGLPTENNAHPHIDSKGRIALVHNGIIENYDSLKTHLLNKGYHFQSETDTEVLVNLISECYEGDLMKATAAALKQVEGTFGIGVISIGEPTQLIIARRGSPIAIGVDDDKTIVASDVAALVAHTKRVIFLDDDDIAAISNGAIEIRNIDNIPVTREIANVDWDVSAAEKGGYEHFMLKEIFEQPLAITNTTRARLDKKQATGTLGGLNMSPREMAQINRIVLAACGTSMHAGMVGEYFFEDLAAIPAEVEQAAEFRYRNPIIEPQTLVLAISQSGETADTLAAVKEAINKGATVASICNVVGSTIARETQRGIYLHAGPEISVASTKAFTCQVVTLLMMALKFGRNRRVSREGGERLIQEIESLPDVIQTVLDSADDIKQIAEKYADKHDFFFIGRGYLYPVALEGALKLKEISYAHAEGYHAAELKHGPIALLDENVPVIALANDIAGKDKIIGNMQECRARKAPVIAVATTGDTSIEPHADDIIYVPKTSKFTVAITTVVALQLFSYYLANKRGCSIDQPKNLAKSVTVE